MTLEVPSSNSGTARVTVASAGMLRVAAWPLASLEALQLTHFRSAADQLDDDEFTAAYRSALPLQQAKLAELTTTAAFERGLALANPIVAGRWRRAGGRAATRRSRDRRLEATVVRFLCRAAGRATPNGAWAGVTPVEDEASGSPRGGAALGTAPGSRLVSVSPAPARWWAAPSLTPFATLCAFLSRQPDYLREGLFELEPTLHRREDRWWVWGPAGWQRLPEHRFLDALVGWFEANEPHQDRLPLRPFVRAIAGPAADGVVWTALERLRELGALCPAARLRPTAGTPGQVLRDVAEALPGRVRPPWMTAVAGLEALSGEVADRFEQLTGQDLATLLDEGTSVLRRLWRELEAPGEPAWPPIRVDAGAPFRAVWSQPARATIARALEELIGLWRADGTPEWYRRRTCSLLGSGSVVDALWSTTARTHPHRSRDPFAVAQRLVERSPTRAGISAAHFGLDRRFAVEQVWTALRITRPGQGPELVVSPKAVEGPWSLDPGAAPLCGAQLVSWFGSRLHLGWGRPQPGLFFGRHWPLDVGRAVQTEIDTAFATTGLDVVDVAGRETANPDAAVRWCTRSPLDVGRRRLVRRMAMVDTPGDVPRLSAGRGGREIVPIYNSAATPTDHDPLSSLMSRLSFAHGWEFMSFGFPLLDVELAQPSVSPRIVTESGHLLSARRMALPSTWVQQVLCATPALRFRAWIRLLDESGLGDLVRVRVGLSQPLLIPVCSPIAVEALFSSLPADPPPVLIEELQPGDVVTDDAGRAYVAELAVAWWRR
jgi:Lantibiotic dehydratase, N terminus